VSYFAAEGIEEQWCAMLREWEREYDAEIVSVSGVTTQLAVGRPPATTETAWQLAADLMAWAGNFHGSRRHLAEGLLDSRLWHLFDRP
jgi:hypothetical protein